MKNKKTLEEDINDFLILWDCQQLCDFLRDIAPVFELYNVADETDWLRDVVGEEDRRNVRLIRTVYLISRIAEFHTGKLLMTKTKFKDIFVRMEKQGSVEIAS